jgi:hypothetical protein
MTFIRCFSGIHMLSFVRLALLAGCCTPMLGAITISISRPPNPSLPIYPPGATVTFSLISPPPVGRLQWFHDYAPIPGATGASLVLADVSTSQVGNYYLQAIAGDTFDVSNTLPLNVLPLPPSRVDRSFVAELPSDVTYISSLTVPAGGKVVVQTRRGNTTLETVRLNADGRRDSSFVFPAAAGTILLEHTDGSLFVTNPPYRVNASGAALSIAFPAGFDATKSLSAAALQSDGKILIAQDGALGRLNADGSVDGSFGYSNPATFPFFIRSVTVDSSSRIYVMGLLDGPAYYGAIHAVYRLKPSGAPDSTFVSTTGTFQLIVVPLADGRIIAQPGPRGSIAWKLLNDDGTPIELWDGMTNVTDGPVLVDAMRGLAYQVGASGWIERYTIGTHGMTRDALYTSGDEIPSSIYAMAVGPAGDLLVSGSFERWVDHLSPKLVRLPFAGPGDILPPHVRISVDKLTPKNGDTVTFRSYVSGTGPFSYQWLALDGQPLPADSRSSALVIAPFSSVSLGRYQVRVTGPGGSVLSEARSAVGFPDFPYLANLSGRGMAGTGENTLIAGVSTKGAVWASTLLRGVGPSLQPMGVANFLPNPAIDLYNWVPQLIANNDQWWQNPSTAAAGAEAGAFSLASQSDDAALIHLFPPGNATLMLKDQTGRTGVGLLEIYLLKNQSFDSLRGMLTNLSFRARTGPGEETAIAGFVLVDPQGLNRSARILLRAVGPALLPRGVVIPLEDPALTIYNSKGEVIARNDDWALNNSTGDSATLSAFMKEVGAFELSTASKDAALLLELPPGAYSMHASGGSGVVLLEIYILVPTFIF